jgi:ferritin-like metal-binding protein YciE
MRSALETRLVRGLGEAFADNVVRQHRLGCQVAAASPGQYRSTLKGRLDEKGSHIQRLKERLGALGEDVAPERVAAEVEAQAIRFSRLALGVLREQKETDRLFRSICEECGSEAAEIASLEGIEALAGQAGDQTTAKLCRDLRTEDERALVELRNLIPEVVTRADIQQPRVFGSLRLGSLETSAKSAVRQTLIQAARLGRQAPGRHRDGYGSQPSQPPIQGYDDLSADRLIQLLSGLSQNQLDQVEVYERANKARKSVLKRIGTLRADQPWPGYDEATVEEIHAGLEALGRRRLGEAADYERQHKARKGVLDQIRKLDTNAE